MSEVDPQEFWDRSAAAWIALADRGDLNRTLVLDPAMLRLAGDVAGLSVCDVGCGEGRFCRMLATRGAQVTGVEPTTRLVEEARKRHPEGHYVQALGEEIPFADGAFDLVVCYMVLIDIPDFRAAIREMARITKPGGRLLIANMNSFSSTLPNPWIRNEMGELQYVRVADYFGERADIIGWADIEIVNYHRPFSAYMEALLAQELRLTDFEEPIPSAAAVAEFPKMADSLRIPNFHVMQWRKD